MNFGFTTAARLRYAIEAFAREQIRRRRMASYLRSDRRPWSTGYHEYKAKYLTNVLNNDDILCRFRQGRRLPNRYGFRLDARVVEIPWVLSRLANQTGHLLDAGSSLNHELVLTSPALADKKITIVTLAPEGQCHWRLGISYMFGDLRDLDFRDGCFDTIVCISTIEHVGMDNTMYASYADAAKAWDVKDFLSAVRELKRVLKVGGVIYFSFPFGEYENHGWFQQFDSQLMDTLIKEFGPIHFNETIFQYDPNGWKLSDRTSCTHCQFFDVHTSKYFDPNSTIEYLPDYPAGERAVACLELFK